MYIHSQLVYRTARQLVGRTLTRSVSQFVRKFARVLHVDTVINVSYEMRALRR